MTHIPPYCTCQFTTIHVTTLCAYQCIHIHLIYNVSCNLCQSSRPPPPPQKQHLPALVHLFALYVHVAPHKARTHGLKHVPALRASGNILQQVKHFKTLLAANVRSLVRTTLAVSTWTLQIKPDAVKAPWRSLSWSDWCCWGLWSGATRAAHCRYCASQWAGARPWGCTCICAWGAGRYG